MSSRKFSFLSSSASKPQVETNETNESNISSGNTPILDTTVIEYLISEFKEPTESISKALINLKDTIENSIDYIEDKSSELIKQERNFALSGKHREAAIRLHEISESINTYVGWIEKGLTSKNTLSYSDFISNNYTPTQLNNETTSNDTNNKSNLTDNIKVKETEASTENNTIYESNSNHKSLFIYEDFTGCSPKSFILKNHSITVDSWDDMLVQTASILTKNYRHFKDSSIKFENTQRIASKKSMQNDLRDTIIEMLIEHKVPLKDYKVFV